MIDYDAELRRHNEVLRLAYGIRPSDRVLDIGCGTGQTTREAAQMASAGEVLGVDRSEEMIDRARALTREAGITNVAYECSDAGASAFAPEVFDVAISRFGTMFFADPVAAFTNIRSALRPDGRLVMMVWQAHDRNKWAQSISHALAGSTVPQGGPQLAFSLGDPDVVRRLLQATGFSDPTFDEVHAPVCYGQSVDDALEFVLEFSNVSAALGVMDENEREQALARLRRMLEMHQTGDGVLLDSRAWVVTTRRI